jgi:hypothetical protein
MRGGTTWGVGVDTGQLEYVYIMKVGCAVIGRIQLDKKFQGPCHMEIIMHLRVP